MSRPTLLVSLALGITVDLNRAKQHRSLWLEAQAAKPGPQEAQPRPGMRPAA